MDPTSSPAPEPAETKPAAEEPRVRYTPRVRERPREAEREQEKERRGSSRETVESIVIAFVLAFLFRTFEAEAFVIPTGSMAPTLMGRHKELACKECGWVFSVGATEGEPHSPTQGVCPNCRFVNDLEVRFLCLNEVGSERNSKKCDAIFTKGSVCPKCSSTNFVDLLAFKGDRILVLKALYDLPEFVPESLREPKRWDVVVFKFPEEPQINYIKRLVGLPDEELRIHYGNIFTKTKDEADFHIARKPPRKQQVMRMLVYDNNHQSPAWKKCGLPVRWQSESGDAWQTSEDGKSFESPHDGAADAWSVLAYRHFGRDWSEAKTLATPHEQLITDFYAYNAGMRDGYFRDQVDPHWVGDLALDMRLNIHELKGSVRVQLVEAGERFICEFNLDSGACRLLRQKPGDRDGKVLATAKDVIRRAGSYAISFANFDDRLTVWVDNRLIFGEGHDYDGAKLGDPQRPTEADLRPASVAVQGAAVRVSDLVLFRDIYYTHGAPGGTRSEYYGLPNNWEETFSNPALWGPLATAEVSRFEPLGPDHFMMCGDNSPRSKDGRLWDEGAQRWIRELARERGDPYDADKVRDAIAAEPGGEVVLADRHVVHRQLLIGRAFYVYWPHGVPFGPDWLQWDTPQLGPLGSFRLPFYPNVARMKMIE